MMECLSSEILEQYRPSNYALPRSDDDDQGESLRWNKRRGPGMKMKARAQPRLQAGPHNP
jgi:hypothetical protein